MGRELALHSRAARAVFEEVDAALGQKLSALMWNGPEAELTLTANAQPAIMAVSMAVVRVLEADHGVSVVVARSSSPATRSANTLPSPPRKPLRLPMRHAS